MLNVPAEISEVIKSGNVFKNFRVHFPNGERSDITNDNIVFESVEFRESVCSEETFTFGHSDSAAISFETVGIENIVGMTIECSMEYQMPDSLVSTYGEWYSIPYGRFVVDSCPRNHENMVHRKVQAYTPSVERRYGNNFEVFKSTVFNVSKTYTPVAWKFLSASMEDKTGLTEKTNGYSSTSYGYGGNTHYLYYSADDGSGANFSVKYDVDLDGYSYAFIDSADGTIRPAFSDVCDFSYTFDKEAYEEIVETLENWITILENGFEGYHLNSNNLTYHISEIKRYLSYLKPQFEYHFDLNDDGFSWSSIYRWDPLSFNVDSDGKAWSPIFYPYRNGIDSWFANLFVASGITASFDIAYQTYGDVDIEPVSYAIDTTFGDQVKVHLYEKENASFSEKLKLKFSSTLQTTKENKAVYSFADAYGVTDILAGWAELNASFLHSERDGTISIEALDNSSPYALTADDIEGSAWWDEYDVKPIGTIYYSFTNPTSGSVDNGIYIYDENTPSVYDLSGNSFLESIDFSITSVTRVDSMTDESAFYLYNGSEDGYTSGDFYYYNGSAWTDGGKYTDATTLVEFYLKQVFIPHMGMVNFTPVEMTLRGLPFLEAGDAFTLTAADGTVISSYILKHNFSGIQHITEDVETVQGTVTDSEVIY